MVCELEIAGQMKTKPHFIAALMLSLAAFAVHAEVPELRQKLPTERRHMERIGAGKMTESIECPIWDSCWQTKRIKQVDSFGFIVSYKNFLVIIDYICFFY